MAEQSFIIGDLGGTSTQWRVVKKGKVSSFTTTGFNAYTHNLDQLKKEVMRDFGDAWRTIRNVYLYVAGVDTPEQKKEVEDQFEASFDIRPSVANDLVGAARALCQDGSGNVCILGTGSNACYYNGKEVNKVSASLGYVLGDEGSGAYLGKKLLMHVFRDQLSKEIIAAFREQYPLTSYDAIQKIYHEPQPNHFLASFATFISTYKEQPEIHRLTYRSFVDFYEAFFYRNKYVDQPFYFSGSIAFHFSDILKEVSNDRQVHIERIVRSPIEDLVVYHQNHG